MAALRHTATGWWLEEAGPVEPTRPLDGDTTADVVVVGGGYLGMWTAWQLQAARAGGRRRPARGGALRARPERPERRLRARRSGATCRRCASAPATSVRSRSCRASEDAVRGIGAWCEAQRASTPGTAPRRSSTSRRRRRSSAPGTASSRHAQAVGAADEVVALSAEEVRADCASPLFLGGARYGPTRRCSRRASRSGCAASCSSAGVRIHERTPVDRPVAARRSPRRRTAASAQRCRARRRTRPPRVSPGIGTRSPSPRATSS